MTPHKRIYFVRHAESEGNIGLVRPGLSPDSIPLTKAGIVQASILAKRLSKIHFESIISSRMKRAEETALLMTKETNQSIEYSNLFIERRRASETNTLSKDDPRRIKVEKEIINNYHLPSYRYSDEENLDDLKERASKALNFLSKKSENSILVVTHATFMRVLVAYIIFGNEMTNRECARCLRALHSNNTGITSVEYNPENNSEFPWSLIFWNDLSHL